MTKKVIIIDDSITQLNILKSLFEKAQWEAYCVRSANAAFSKIFEIAPDLIITDAIMPVYGGFRLIKTIRENPYISLIPIIVYSVLNESNAKFYVKEELSEYFLRKDDNAYELIDLAEEIVKKHPLSEEYKNAVLVKNEILKDETEENPEPDEIIKQDEESVEAVWETVADISELGSKLSLKSDFSFDDEKLISDFFTVVYPFLNYDLGVVCLESFEKKIKIAYFDIRDIILSPILQNKILSNTNSAEAILYKKYAPNLKITTNLEEFHSCLEFDFEYIEKQTAKVIFYSKKDDFWPDEEKKEIIKAVLDEFFKLRYINKNQQINKKESNRYLSGRLFGNLFSNAENKKNQNDTYFACIQISNFSDLKNNLTYEELDIINSKISEKIMNCLDKNEQIYKSDEDEYSIAIFAKDSKQAYNKLSFILNSINGITYNTYKTEVLAGASSCRFEETFNIAEAQKNAHNALEQANESQRVVIK